MRFTFAWATLIGIAGCTAPLGKDRAIERNKIDELEAKVGEQDSRVEQLRESNRTLRAERDRYHDRNDDLTKLLSDARLERDEAVAAMERFKSQLAESEVKQRNLTIALDEIRKNRASQADQVTEAQRRAATLEQDLADSRKQLIELRGKLMEATRREADLRLELLRVKP